jgi:hypothetical protein
MTELRVEFDAKVKDLVASSMLAARMSGIIRRQMTTLIASGSIFLGLAAASVVLADLNAPSLAWPALAILTLSIGVTSIVYGILAPQIIRNTTETIYSTQQYRLSLGRCVITINDTGFRAESSGGTYQHSWQAIFWVRVERQHVFVAAGTLTYPIPRRAFSSDVDFEQFAELVRSHIP